MAYLSAKPTAKSDILTVLTQMATNDAQLEAWREQMQSAPIAYKVWEDNSAEVGITQGQYHEMPPVSVQFTPPEDAFYRVAFYVPRTTGGTFQWLNVGIGDNNVILDPVPAGISDYHPPAYLWGKVEYPYNRCSNFSNTWPPGFVAFDRWLIGGKTYSITGLIWDAYYATTKPTAYAYATPPYKSQPYIVVYKTGIR